jgi:superfamily II DNA or RNA helicase
MRLAVCKGKKCIFLADRMELINQASDKINDLFLPHGIIMAGHGYTPAPIQVCSKDTLYSRAIRREIIEFPPADIVIVDEAHLSMAPTFKAIIEQYPRAVIIGLSATPARLDGKGLGDIYQKIIQPVKINELIRDGYLVPTRIFAPYHPDLRKVKLSGGDWQKDELSKRMNKTQITGDIISHWVRHADKRKTVVFACTIEHSINIKNEFCNAGYKWEHVDGTMNPKEREKILERLNSGSIDGVSNCQVYTLGWDAPIVSCAIMARPTKSHVLFLQMCGRIMRPYPSKTDALILDHADNVIKHGFPDEEIQWRLEKSSNINKEIQKKMTRKDESTPILCPACSALFKNSPVCPNCGHRLRHRKKGINVNTKNGTLVEITRNGKIDEYLNEYQRTWQKCIAICVHKNLSIGVAAAMMQRETGLLPWEIPGLRNTPKQDQYQQMAADIFPQFKKVRLK